MTTDCLPSGHHDERFPLAADLSRRRGPALMHLDDVVDRWQCRWEPKMCSLLYIFHGNTSEEVQPSLQVVVVYPAAN
jgi:hypothetical protein